MMTTTDDEKTEIVATDRGEIARPRILIVGATEMMTAAIAEDDRATLRDPGTDQGRRVPDDRSIHVTYRAQDHHLLRSLVALCHHRTSNFEVKLRHLDPTLFPRRRSLTGSPLVS